MVATGRSNLLSLFSTAAVMSYVVNNVHKMLDWNLDPGDFLGIDPEFPTVDIAADDSGFSPHYRNLYQYHKPQRRTPKDVSSDFAQCGTFPDFNDFFALTMHHRSRLQEDKIIYETFFKDMDQGVETFKYIELGAFNGVRESNTRFFDLCLGWEGLLIEPNPKIYEQLITNRPGAHRVSFAASCSESEAKAKKTVAFHNFPFTNAAQSDVTSSFEGRETVNVPCGPLTPLISDLLDGHVHFMSLDVENVEHLVLGNIDFEKVFIEVLIVESSNGFCLDDCESRDKSREILLQHGYHLFEGKVKKSDLFIHPRSELLRTSGMLVK